MPNIFDNGCDFFSANLHCSFLQNFPIFTHKKKNVDKIFFLNGQIHTIQSYDKIILQQILSNVKCCTIDKKGRVLPPSDEVYKTISKLMANKGSRITPKYIHTIVNNNRHGFKDYILKTFDIQEQELTTSISNNDFNVTECVDQNTDSQTSSTSIDINLVISQDKWLAIRPQKKIYGKRTYWKLREG